MCLAYFSVPRIRPRWAIRFPISELDDGESSQFDEVAFWLLVCNSFITCLTLGTEEEICSACARTEVELTSGESDRAIFDAIFDVSV